MALQDGTQMTRDSADFYVIPTEVEGSLDYARDDAEYTNKCHFMPITDWIHRYNRIHS